MERHVETVLQIDNEKQMEKSPLVWLRMFGCIVELLVGIKSSTTELAKHMSGIEVAEQKAAAKKKVDEEKEAAASAKQEVSKRAASIKQAVKEQKEKLPALFAIPDDKFKAFLVLKDVDASLHAACNFDEPFAMVNSTLLQSWIADKTITQVMMNYGSRYLKQDSTNNESKHTQTVVAKQGKEQTERFFASLLAGANSKVICLSAASMTWNSTSWLWGYAKDYHACSLTPNSSGLFRLVVFGCLEVYTVEFSTLLPAMKKLSRPAEKLNDVIEAVQGLSEQDLKKLQGEGVKIFYHKLEKEQMVWIPCGWVLIEPVKSSNLIYGVRKSVLLRTAKVIESYKAAKDWLTASGSNVAKMGDVLDCLQKPN